MKDEAINPLYLRFADRETERKFIRACWGIKIIESRANFVVSKHQSYDQTMDAIDRLSMGRNIPLFQHKT